MQLDIDYTHQNFKKRKHQQSFFVKEVDHK